LAVEQQRLHQLGHARRVLVGTFAPRQRARVPAAARVAKVSPAISRNFAASVGQGVQIGPGRSRGRAPRCPAPGVSAARSGVSSRTHVGREPSMRRVRAEGGSPSGAGGASRAAREPRGACGSISGRRRCARDLHARRVDGRRLPSRATASSSRPSAATGGVVGRRRRAVGGHRAVNSRRPSRSPARCPRARAGCAAAPPPREGRAADAHGSRGAVRRPPEPASSQIRCLIEMGPMWPAGHGIRAADLGISARRSELPGPTGRDAARGERTAPARRSRATPPGLAQPGRGWGESCGRAAAGARHCAPGRPGRGPGLPLGTRRGDRARAVPRASGAAGGLLRG
jgi:hypothetical protein